MAEMVRLPESTDMTEFLKFLSFLESKFSTIPDGEVVMNGTEFKKSLRDVIAKGMVMAKEESETDAKSEIKEATEELRRVARVIQSSAMSLKPHNEKKMEPMKKAAAKPLAELGKDKAEEMADEVMRKTDTAGMNREEVSAIREEVVKEIREAMKSGQKVSAENFVVS